MVVTRFFYYFIFVTKVRDYTFYLFSVIYNYRLHKKQVTKKFYDTERITQTSFLSIYDLNNIILHYISI